MGNSLLEDAISFFTDNIEKAGQAFKESNERDRALIQSYRSGGAVDPQQRQGMLEEYIGHANPMGAVGGMIKPSTWARYTPRVKTEMTMLANRSPQAFKERVLDTPHDIYTKLDPTLGINIGGNITPGYPVSSAIDMPAIVRLNPKHKSTSNRFLEHELLHNVNDITKRVTNTDPDDAWTIARLLQTQIPAGTRGSLDKVIAQNTQPASGGGLLNWDTYNNLLNQAYDSRPLKKLPPRTYALEGWAAMDESLAHLSEAAAKPNASPEIRKLARDMGVSWEDKTREVMFGGPNSPKWNPRDVPMPPRAIEPTVNIPRSTVSQGALDAFNALKQRFGLDATFRHGTDPKSAIGIIKEGLKPGSSVSKAGGRDFEGYPVTFEFDDSLKGAKAYDSPFGPTAHEGAARTGEAAKNIKRVFFDPDEFSYKEDALDIFRDLRKSLNESGRKDLKIERARWDDAADKWRYGEKLSLKGMKTFSDYVKKTKNLDRLFNETMDNLDNVPDDRAKVFRNRLDTILEEMANREGKTRDATFGKFKGEASNPSEVLNTLRHELDLRRQAAGYKDPVSMDQTVREVMDLIGRKLVKSDPTADFVMNPGGVSGIRKELGDMLPLSKVQPGSNMNPGRTWASGKGGQMKMEDFRGLLQQLDKYGLLKTPQAGGSEFTSSNAPLGHHINSAIEEFGGVGWKPEVLRRLKRFIEETKE